MSLSGYDLGPPSPDAMRGAVNSEPALTVPGSASPEGTYLASPQEAVSPVPIDDLWGKALDNYGLLRPTEVTEIHVFRVLQSSWDKNAHANHWRVAGLGTRRATPVLEVIPCASRLYVVLSQ